MIEDVGYLLKRVQHTLRLAIDDNLAEIQLTLPQYAALSILETEPGLSNAELARQSFVTPQTMHQIVTGLEDSALVVRQPHPQLRRIQQIFLSAAGERLLGEAHQLVGIVHSQMLSQLNDSEIAQLGELLQKCETGLNSAPQT